MKMSSHIARGVALGSDGAEDEVDVWGIAEEVEEVDWIQGPCQQMMMMILLLLLFW